MMALAKYWVYHKMKGVITAVTSTEILHIHGFIANSHTE